MSPREPQDLRALLPAFLGRLARAGTPATLLQPIWADLVGDALAVHSRPTRLQGDRLEITADEPMWAGVIEAKSREILEKLTLQHPELGVRRLEVRVP